MSLQQFTRCTKMTDIGHTATDKHLVDPIALNVGQQAGIVRIVGRADDRLIDISEVDLDDCGVFGVGVGLEQSGRGQPCFHVSRSSLQRPGVTIAFCNHRPQQYDV